MLSGLNGADCTRQRFYDQCEMEVDQAGKHLATVSVRWKEHVGVHPSTLWCAGPTKCY